MSQAGFGYPFKARNDRLVALAVFQSDDDFPRKVIVYVFYVFHVSLFEKDVRDRPLHVGAGHFHRFVFRGERVSDSCEHICNRICHDVPPYQLAFLTPGI